MSIPPEVNAYLEQAAAELRVAGVDVASVDVNLPFNDRDYDEGGVDWLQTKILHHTGAKIIPTPELLPLYEDEAPLHALRVIAPVAKGGLVPMGLPCSNTALLADTISLVATRTLGEIIRELDRREMEWMERRRQEMIAAWKAEHD